VLSEPVPVNVAGGRVHAIDLLASANGVKTSDQVLGKIQYPPCRVRNLVFETLRVCDLAFQHMRLHLSCVIFWLLHVELVWAMCIQDVLKGTNKHNDSSDHGWNYRGWDEKTRRLKDGGSVPVTTLGTFVR
jgi:hypothetical protein